MDDRPLVSIVVPTRNEEADIGQTMEALLTIAYRPLEILVVDDSTDRTPGIVQRYVKDGIRLLRGPRSGRCEARNLGIRESKGEIAVILNADVQLPPDFVDRILPHYRNGADFLLVEARVMNLDFLFPRYVQALHTKTYPDLHQVLWTEGFSCRRQAALQAGLFPEGFPLPLLGGEDWIFAERLLANGYSKAVDPKIVVRHIVPPTFQGFWRQRVDRGRADPLLKYFLLGRSLLALFAEAWIRSAVTAIAVGSIAPMALKAVRLSRGSERGVRDILPFAWAAMLEWSGYLVGVWQGLDALAGLFEKSQVPLRWKRMDRCVGGPLRHG